MAADALHIGDGAHAAHEVLTDAQLHLAADAQRRGQEPVERVVDAALGRVLDGHHAEVGVARLHLVEHLVDGTERERARRVAEMFVDRGLREGALGAEEADLERFLLGEAGRHDLAEQPYHLVVAQRTRLARLGVALERHAQHLSLSLGPVEVDEPSLLALRDAHRPREARALVEQRVQLAVDGIDAAAKVAEGGGRVGCLGGRRGLAVLPGLAAGSGLLGRVASGHVSVAASGSRRSLTGQREVRLTRRRRECDRRRSLGPRIQP